MSFRNADTYFSLFLEWKQPTALYSLGRVRSCPSFAQKAEVVQKPCPHCSLEEYFVVLEVRLAVAHFPISVYLALVSYETAWSHWRQSKLKL